MGNIDVFINKTFESHQEYLLPICQRYYSGPSMYFAMLKFP